MIRPLLFIAAAISAISMLAEERTFTYNFDGKETRYYGTNRQETIDVAVCINSPALVGSKVKGISVPLPGPADAYGDLSAFLTSELKIELVEGLRVNNPDICSVPATLTDGILTATFPEPYVITDAPLYVGYSFIVKTLTDESKTPVAIVTGSNPDGLWFHSNRSYLKWTNFVDREAGGIQSAMNIILDGDFSSCAAIAQLPSRAVYSTAEEEAPYRFTVVNYGNEPISEVECEWTVGDEHGTATCKFLNPIPNSLGASAKALITLPGIGRQGAYDVRIDVNSVNGKKNESSLRSAVSGAIFTDIMPVKLPLIEEYTGLWCGNCPRGYAALEWMKEKYGFEFVAASWHNGDPMAITSSYPSTMKGYPSAWIDRSLSIDPGLIPQQWASWRSEPTDYAISCSITLDPETQTGITATANVTPIVGNTTPLSLGYILIADSLTNPTWFQTNSYSGSVSDDMPGEWGKFFAEQGKNVQGLIFNDVVVGNEYVKGVKGSLPEVTEAFATYTHEVAFDLSGIVKSLPLEPDKVRVIAFILDDKGNVLNSCTSLYAGEGVPELGADAIETQPEVTETIWYDLRGVRRAAPAEGVSIRVDVLSDGTCRSSKIFLQN